MSTGPLWTPSEERIGKAHLTSFIRQIASLTGGPGLDNLAALYRWSVEQPDDFWPLVWQYCGLIHEGSLDPVIVDRDKMPGAQWFRNARLNFAENLLRHRGDMPALIFWNEFGRQQAVSREELRSLVARLQEALEQEGVRPGERVAGYLPNCPQTVAAMLAATSLGAAWTSCSPDFGLRGVLDRFGQTEPKVLFATDGYFYKGKPFTVPDRAGSVAREVPSIERTVILPYVERQPATDGIRNAVLWDDFLSGTDRQEPRFERFPFDHPLYVMYSSGTTGPPKCIVHGAGGTLLQHAKEHTLHADLHEGDAFFYFTTCGWMMWNWLVSGLAAGATVLLYDGSPFHNRASQLFDMAEQERITVFGTSAKYIAAAEKEGLRPAQTHDLSALKTILSTGSPLAPESFDYVYRDVKADVCLSSITGGTDLISCFALGNPIGSVYRGEIQTRGLGMKVEVFDDQGQSLPRGKGELVCTAPFPSMPVGFWNDPDGAKYRGAYFERFPGVWHHGDFCELTEHDGMIIWGRSDAVLNPGGVRIGTAEIYRVVEGLDEVGEAVCVGQEWDSDVRVVLFVTLRKGVQLTDELKRTIRGAIRTGASPRHVPAKIIAVKDIPRTLNGKVAELAVRQVIHGQKVKNRDALANPESLAFFAALPELQS